MIKTEPVLAVVKCPACGRYMGAFVGKAQCASCKRWMLVDTRELVATQ